MVSWLYNKYCKCWHNVHIYIPYYFFSTPPPLPPLLMLDFRTRPLTHCCCSVSILVHASRALVVVAYASSCRYTPFIRVEACVFSPALSFIGRCLFVRVRDRKINSNSGNCRHSNAIAIWQLFENFPLSLTLSLSISILIFFQSSVKSNEMASFAPLAVFVNVIAALIQ